jgi:hypothetical protein
VEKYNNKTQRGDEISLSKETVSPQKYYSCHGLMTDPEEYGFLFDDLPTKISELCETVQGLLIHIFWADRLGFKLSKKRKLEVNIRSIARKLENIQKMNDSPLTLIRPLEERVVGNCRDFATMLCAMLRHKGVPARARCGFGTYFESDQYMDHWICEYWKANEQRWVMVDSQLDRFQRQTLQIKFDPCDLPSGQFLCAGKAWQLCRDGKTDPDRFGIFDFHGMGFIMGNLLRDLASLNKIELLPWDCWGLSARAREGERTLSEKEKTLLDSVAALTLSDNSVFQKIRSTYESNPELRVPRLIKSYTPPFLAVRTVDIFSQS